MTYCNLGETAKVDFKFADYSDIYITENVPISVTANQKFIPGKCPTYYTVFYSGSFARGILCDGGMQAANGSFSHILGVIQEVRWDFSVESGTPVAKIICIDANGTIHSGLSITGGICPDHKQYSLTSITYQREDGLADECAPENCEIKICSGENIIFSAEGECPCKFTVDCGDCPEGYLKCNTPNYPGYCCIPCDEIKDEIKGLIQKIRTLNHG